MAIIYTSQTQQPLTEAQRKEKLKALAAQKERDYEMISGIVENREAPGYKVEFFYKKYPGDFKGYSFEDGEKVQIPRMVAEHLNSGCFYYEYEHQSDANGVKSSMRNANIYGGSLDAPNYQIKRKIYRYSFKPLMFTDDDFGFTQPNIIEATITK